jgi:hypothetical protein
MAAPRVILSTTAVRSRYRNTRCRRTLVCGQLEQNGQSLVSQSRPLHDELPKRTKPCPHADIPLSTVSAPGLSYSPIRIDAQIPQQIHDVSWHSRKIQQEPRKRSVFRIQMCLKRGHNLIEPNIVIRSLHISLRSKKRFERDSFSPNLDPAGPVSGRCTTLRSSK